jgi:hypothetical protein
MNTVRAALVTKSGNPLSDESLVELTLRVMSPAARISNPGVIYTFNGVAA